MDFNLHLCRRKAAFTLAEVLITLGIIGVVAALTLPNLMADTKKKEYSVRLKKFYSIMNQAIMLSEVQNGSMKNWTQCSNLLPECKASANGGGNGYYDSAETFYNTYLAPYLDSYKTKRNGSHLYVYLDDGSSFSLWQGSCIDVVYDVNSFDQLPNQMGRDQFYFLICSAASKEWSTEAATFITYGNDSQRQRGREYNLNRCKSDTRGCSLLLQIDNWEFKDDYPYKL